MLLLFSLIIHLLIYYPTAGLGGMGGLGNMGSMFGQGGGLGGDRMRQMQEQMMNNPQVITSNKIQYY